MRIKDKQLNKINGGGITGSIINYLSSLIKTVFGVGQSVGGAIRRIASRNVCPL